jgi:hypothetical protein
MFEPQTYAANPDAPKAPVLPPDNKGRSGGVDWERGAEQSLTDLTVRDQVWRSRVLMPSGEVQVTQDQVTWVPALTEPDIDIKTVSFSFDLNMRPFVAYKLIGGTSSMLYWFDGTIPGYATLTVTDVESSYLVFDFPFKADADGAEVLWFYVVGDQCLYRRQSDRFTIEHTFGTVPAGRKKITGVGMSRNWRLHVRFGK